MLAAEGWALATGDTGVAAVTAGPGFANGLIGLLDAGVWSVPLVMLAGRTSRNRQGRGAVGDVDQLAIAAPIAKWAATLHGARAGPAIHRRGAASRAQWMPRRRLPRGRLARAVRQGRSARRRRARVSARARHDPRASPQISVRRLRRSLQRSVRSSSPAAARSGRGPATRSRASPRSPRFRSSRRARHAGWSRIRIRGAWGPSSTAGSRFRARTACWSSARRSTPT